MNGSACDCIRRNFFYKNILAVFNPHFNFLKNNEKKFAKPKSCTYICNQMVS